jgi:hypothetical protein
MTVGEMFPSKYYKAGDLAGGSLTLKIREVRPEVMGDGTKKWVLDFVRGEKGLVMNKTNANVLVALYGEDVDEWVGKSIQLTAATTEFGGKTVECIRLKPPVSGELKRPEFD